MHLAIIRASHYRYYNNNRHNKIQKVKAKANYACLQPTLKQVAHKMKMGDSMLLKRHTINVQSYL